MDSAINFRRLIVAWILFAGFSLGLISGLVGGLLAFPNEKEIICPPFMDKSLYEIKGVYVWYELGQAPTEYTELGYEFVEACGYTIINDPVRIEPPEPPPPEEGGA